jgi:hypothetical protein
LQPGPMPLLFFFVPISFLATVLRGANKEYLGESRESGDVSASG